MKEPKYKIVGTRVTEEQARAWAVAAASEGRTLSNWLRRVADCAAEATSVAPT